MATILPLPLQSFIDELERLLAGREFFDPAAPPGEFLAQAADALGRLVRLRSWLPPAYARPHAQYYRQLLLYRDPESRFSIVSFVWGPGQRTPIHDHQVWGLVGILDGAEYSQSYRPHPLGEERALVSDGSAKRLQAGAVEILSPAEGDIHMVYNAFDDRTSVSIHVYGADIGSVERWVYPADTPAALRKRFVSGYGNDAETPPFSGVERTATV
jgi:predicted metal-dependent enzyme (double-stranded beta helix superfamily)